MIEPVFTSDTYAAATKMLDAVALRHEAIASNIANVETPGYRRVDLSTDFLSELQMRMKADNPDFRNLAPSLEVDATATAVRPDGNSVKLEQEMIEMNRNAVSHDFLTQVVSSNLKQLKIAITGRVV